MPTAGTVVDNSCAGFFYMSQENLTFLAQYFEMSS
jgi:hypothetical protein